MTQPNNPDWRDEQRGMQMLAIAIISAFLVFVLLIAAGLASAP
jgi:hypothetical protein